MGTHNGVFCEEDEAPIKPTYEQLEQLYFAQCEATDEWADKCEQLKQENASLIHDLNQYILIANTTSTDLAQAQAEKAELVRQCAEIVGRYDPDTDDALGAYVSRNAVYDAILSLLPKEQSVKYEQKYKGTFDDFSSVPFRDYRPNGD